MCVCVCVCVCVLTCVLHLHLFKKMDLWFSSTSWCLRSGSYLCYWTARKERLSLHYILQLHLRLCTSTWRPTHVYTHTHTHTHTHKSQPILPWTQNRVCGHLKAPRTIPWYPLDRKAIRLCSPSKREAEQAAPFRRAECIPSRPYIASSFIYLDIFFGHRRQE